MNAEKSRLYTLHPISSAIYFACIALFSMLSVSPVISAISLFGAVLLFALLSRPSLFRKTLLLSLLTVIIMTAINPVVSQNGATVLFGIFGIDVTLEALLYGLNFSAMLVAVLLWCICGGGILDGDRIIFLVGGFAPKTALLISMTVKNIPEFSRKAREISRARLASGALSEGGVKGGIVSAVKTFSVLVGCSLEGAVETERQMKARGYGGERGRYERYKFSVTDGIFLALTALSFFVCILGKALGGRFEFYPEMSGVPLGYADIVLYISFFVLAVLPSIFEVFGRIKWKYYELKV